MPSRISGACTPCRSKKQKCSGHHPICSQCQGAAIDCTWPEQRKRGPAKGYIEALESRLHTAESLLLAILPLIDNDIVSRASDTLQDHDDDNVEGYGGRRSSPPLLNKKTGIEYWESFPLDTCRNIRQWQRDCETNSSVNNAHYTSRDSTSLGRRNRSATRSPASVGMASPRGSTPAMSQHSNWVSSMQPYVSPPNHMQTGAAQQLVNLSSQRRDQWMMTQQHNHGSDAMQLDPNLMQPRSMPQTTPHIYAGNMQTNLFW